MKWIFYVIIFIYMFYRAVYGLKTKDVDGASMESVKYEKDNNYILPGARKTVNCIGANKNKTMEWIDPTGAIVKRVPANRVYVQENLVSMTTSPSSRTRVSALMLVFTSVDVDDTGVWVCHGGKFKQDISLCVINPSRFVDNATVYEMDSGRSITLTCHAKGDPEPNVLWYRNGELITDDATSSKYQLMTKYNLKDSEGLLTITSLQAEDSGVYTCDAVQHSPNIDDCVHIESMNITLQVNYAPVFKDGNETTIVYGTEGESLELICSANGFPIPTYEWLEDNDETSSKFGQDKIELRNDGTEAVLTLEPNSYNWNQRYRCRAMNIRGDVNKSFLVLKTEKPAKPTYVQPHSESADSIQLEISWNNGMNFPVDSIDVQYLKAKSLKGRKPKESDWARAKRADLNPNDNEGLNVILADLDETTNYYIRLRAVNSVGQSQWSKPVLASTIDRPEIPEESEEQEESIETTAQPVSGSVSDSAFYGVFFVGCVMIVVIVAIFIMKMI